MKPSLRSAAAITLLLSASAHAQPGTLDPLFGTGGWLGLDGAGTILTVETAYDMEVQPDGRIVMVGYFADQKALVRCLPNGSLDASFGTGGVADLNVALAGPVWNIALQPDGKILLTSSTFDGVQARLAVVRYLPNGTLDITFGGDGIAEVTIGTDTSEGYDVTVQDDGKIVVAGQSVENALYSATTVRFMPNGTVDTGFSGDGVVQWTENGDETVRSVAIQADGRILVAGAVPTAPGVYDAFVLRYMPNGTPDNTFGTNGAVTLDIGSQDDFTRVLLQPDGKIVLTGNTGDVTTHPIAVRLNTNGSFDPSFGTAGIVHIASPVDALSYGSLLQATGEIVLTLTVFDPDNTESALVRLTSTGVLDPSFGMGGVAWGPLAPDQYHYNQVKQLPSGQLLVCGALVYSSTESDILLARHITSGTAGMHAQENNGTLTVWPVPTTGILNLAANDLRLAGAVVEIRDATGRTFLAEVIRSNGELRIDVSSLPPGVYTITARTGTGILAKRFMKN